MLDRRQSARDKVMYGGVAKVDDRGGSRDCVVRNISENGASIEFGNDFRLPKRQMRLTIARKGRSFLAKIIWWRDNFVGVAFHAETPSDPRLGHRGAAAQERDKKTPATAPHQTTFGRLRSLEG